MYGIANLRDKTESDVAATLDEVAYLLYQDDLMRKAKGAGKLGADYRVMQRYRDNHPEKRRWDRLESKRL